MFARINAAVLTLAMAFTSVAASPVEARTDTCNNGSAQCCQSTNNRSDPHVAGLASLFGVAGTITEGFGWTCSPLQVGGISGDYCEQHTVCCTGNNYNGGALVVGCSPFSDPL